MSRAQTKIIFFGENKNGAQFSKHLVTFGGVQMFRIIWTFRTKPRGHFHAADIEDKSHIDDKTKLARGFNEIKGNPCPFRCFWKTRTTKMRNYYVHLLNQKLYLRQSKDELVYRKEKIKNGKNS